VEFAEIFYFVQVVAGLGEERIWRVVAHGGHGTPPQFAH
jgi:hypothetical protein